MSNKTIYLKNYKISSYNVESLDLIFELEKKFTLVTNEAVYVKNKKSLENNLLKLDGNNLELIDVFLDEKKIPLKELSIKDNILLFENLPNKFKLKIITKIYPNLNTALEGLYISNNIYCTQCESQGFRNITYYLDRPDVMGVFSTKIIANKKDNPVLLSNGNLVESGDLENGRHFTLWSDPFKKPSYLFALVAGKLEFIEDKYITTSGKKVTLRIFTEINKSSKAIFAMESLKRAMKWDEDRFDLEYDLDLFMIVAVDDFNSGAMENKGLNIFNSALIFASPETSTDKDYIYIERVVGHEYFHNWTGNRVTCRDWFQLSLKEGLTVFRDSEFTADMHSRSVKRIEDIRYLKNHQFREDLSPISHPIRPSSFQKISNFYTVTVYEKGSEVVRLYQTILGKDGFKKGMDLYFKRYDGKAVTTEDFLFSMRDANLDFLEKKGINLDQMQVWYDQAGTPIVKIKSNYDSNKKIYSLKIIQSCLDNKSPFIIPIKFGLLDSLGNDIFLKDDIILLTQFEETFVFKNITSEPTPSFLREFSAPINLNYNYTYLNYNFLIKNDNDEFNRFDAIQKFAMEILLDIISTGTEVIDPLFKDSFKSLLLNKNISTSFKAESITLPSENLIADTLGSDINPEKIFKARNYFIKILANVFIEEFQYIYEKLNIIKPYKINSNDIGDRKLKNITLEYLSIIKGPDLAYNAYYKSNNMTDTFSALTILSNIDCEKRKEVLTDFYEKWKNEPNTINKWFLVQATSVIPSALDKIKELSNHKLFDITNPNKVRSLYNSFSMLNPVIFNNKNSYSFIADKVIELNKINPAISSRLLKTMINWKNLDTELGKYLKKELIRISNSPGLSGDVYEIVTKSL